MFREESHCWLCQREVDQHLPAQHRGSRSVDHLVQLCHEGPALDRTNLRMAHRACNTARSNRLRNVAPDQCACTTQGLPCAPLTPTTGLSVDLTTV